MISITNQMFSMVNHVIAVIMHYLIRK